MANSMFSQFGNNIPVNSFSQIIEQAKQLKRTLQGNPRETVQQLLNSGQMTQEQFNQYSQIAQQVVRSMQNK